MTTKTGRLAEAIAAEFLKKHGFVVEKQNWHTRYCEIDIVASNAGVVHLVEVKYRSDVAYGDGYDYITRSKLHQLRRASQFYQSEVGKELNMQIDVIAIAGDLDHPVIELIENITA